MKKVPVKDIILGNYSYEYCPTDSSTGGTLLNIRNHLSHTIIGAIYRHPNWDDLNENSLNIFQGKTSKEKMSLFLLGDFKVDLLKYDYHAATNEFLDMVSVISTYSYNSIQSIRVSSNSETVTDNFFPNISALILFSEILLSDFFTISHNSPLFLTFFLVGNLIFTRGIRLTLTEKILFLIIFQKTGTVL